MSAVTTIVTRLANITHDEHALVRRFDNRALYFSKGDLKTVAAELGLSTAGNRSALCYRIARHLKAA